MQNLKKKLKKIKTYINDRLIDFQTYQRSKGEGEGDAEV